MLITKFIGNEIIGVSFCSEYKSHLYYYNLLILELGITLRFSINVSQPKESFLPKSTSKIKGAILVVTMTYGSD